MKEKDAIKEGKRILDKVLEKFPEIKERIEIAYSTFYNFNAGYKCDTDNLKFKIELGHSFFKYSDEKKEAFIAHEIGHHFHIIKSYKQKRLKRIKKWNHEALNNPHINQYGIKSRLRRIKKWDVMYEIYADNIAAKAGYAKPLLDHLKKYYEDMHKFLGPITKDRVSARIENLENLLKN